PAARAATGLRSAAPSENTSPLLFRCFHRGSRRISTSDSSARSANRSSSGTEHSVLRHRRLIAVVCIVVLCAAPMAPLSSTSICAILVPLPPLFGAVVSVPLAEPEPVQFRPPFTAAPLPSRAPPVAT